MLERLGEACDKEKAACPKGRAAQPHIRGEHKTSFASDSYNTGTHPHAWVTNTLLILSASSRGNSLACQFLL